MALTLKSLLQKLQNIKTKNNTLHTGQTKIDGSVTLESLLSLEGSGGYVNYTCQLFQSNTGNAWDNVLGEHGLSDYISWERLDVGIYRGTLEGDESMVRSREKQTYIWRYILNGVPFLIPGIICYICIMEQTLRARVALFEGIFISYKKLLEEFHKNSKNVIKEEWEWYREILVDGRNESKMQLAHATDELRNFREGLNPLFIYKRKKDDSLHTEAR